MNEIDQLRWSITALKNLKDDLETSKFAVFEYQIKVIEDQLNSLEMKISDLKYENDYIVTENNKFHQEIHELLNEREYLNTAIDYYYDGDYYDGD